MSTNANNSNPQVDLVIAIDTSASMEDEAEALSKAAEDAIESARKSCPSDLQVAWLGIEGTWKNTKFNRTIREYLTQECKVPESAIRGRKLDEVDDAGAQEDGARSIEDVSNHFNWRPDAKRAVFLLTDEALEGGGDKVEQEDIDAADRAIDIAKKKRVTVHTYFGTTISALSGQKMKREDVQKEVARLAQETGGNAFTEKDSIKGFTQVLQKIICATRKEALENPVTGGEKKEVPSTATVSSIQPTVDLVILADTNASMKNDAEALSHAAEAAIAAARKKHPKVDLKIEWMGVEGTWKGTQFGQTIHDYFTKTSDAMKSALGGKKPAKAKERQAQSEGTRAIEDISSHFSWRNRESRTLFYLSNEALHGGDNRPEQKDINAAKKAIQIATKAGVTVHTYFGATLGKHNTELQKEYAHLAKETGGFAFTEKDTKEGFNLILDQTFNAACEQAEAKSPGNVWKPGPVIEKALQTYPDTENLLDRVAERAPVYKVEGTIPAGRVPLSVTLKDDNILKLEAELERLQNEWQTARGDIQKLSLSGGFGAFSALSGQFAARDISGEDQTNMKAVLTATKTQWEARYKETQERFLEIQTLVEQAQTALFEASQSLSFNTVAKETIQSGQSSLQAWFAAVATSLSHYEATGSTTLASLAQAQTALAQMQAFKEMAWAERYALWGWVTELQSLLVNREEASTAVQANLTQIEVSKKTFQAEVGTLKDTVTELETTLAQKEGASAKMQAELDQLKAAEQKIQGERDTLTAQINQLKATVSKSDAKFESMQKEIERLEMARETVQTELSKWEERYNEAQTALQVLQRELDQVTAKTTETAGFEAMLVDLRRQIKQLEIERDKALTLEQQASGNVLGELEQWKKRYSDGQETLIKLRIELERAQSPGEEQSVLVGALQAERDAFKARVTELEKTVTKREGSSEAMEMELMRAVDAQKGLLAERGQWEARYREGLKEVQMQLEKLKLARGSEVTVTEVTKVTESQSSAASSQSAQVSGSRHSKSRK